MMRFSRFSFLRACALCLPLASSIGMSLAAGVTAPAAVDASAILEASDRVRFPRQSFRMNIDLYEYRGGTLADSLLLAVYARAEPGARQTGNLIRYEKPAKDAGKLMLFHGHDLWFYDPASQASVRLSPQQRLIGQASNGDVMATSFAGDYSATLGGEEDITDGEKVQRTCYKLLLRAATSDAAYSNIEYWVEKDSNRPVKARFLSASGQLLKTAYYRKFERILDSQRPLEVVIIDGLNAKLVTIMRFSRFAYRNVPAAWMQRDFLPRFQEE